jgi:hypothetical protein
MADIARGWWGLKQDIICVFGFWRNVMFKRGRHRQMRVQKAGSGRGVEPRTWTAGLFADSIPMELVFIVFVAKLLCTVCIVYCGLSWTVYIVSLRHRYIGVDTR